MTLPGGGTADDYRWSEDRNFKIGNLQGAKEQWIKWFHVWREVYISEGNDHLGFILDYVSKTEEPIIVVKWLNGLFYVWDGNHRIAASYVLGIDTVRAVVGELR